MGRKWFMGWLNDGHSCSGLSNSLKRHFFGKLSRLKRKLPRSQELDRCVVRFKQKQRAPASLTAQGSSMAWKLRNKQAGQCLPRAEQKSICSHQNIYSESESVFLMEGFQWFFLQCQTIKFVKCPLNVLTEKKFQKAFIVVIPFSPVFTLPSCILNITLYKMIHKY